MPTKTLLPILFLLSIIYGCQKKVDQSTSSPAPTSGNILSNNAHIVDTTAIASSTFTTITLHKSSLNFTPAAGDILLASPSAKDTLGIMIKVLGVTENGTDYTITTQPSNLNDAFRQLYIDYKYSQTYVGAATYGIGNVTGVSGNGTELGLTLDHNLTIAAGLDLGGGLKLNFPETQIKYVKKDGDLLPDTVIVAAGFDTKGSSFKASGNAKFEYTEKQIGPPFYLPTIYVGILIGPVLLIIPFTQEVVINILPASISGKFKYSTYPNVTGTLGVAYENGNWQNLSGFSISAAADSLYQTDFDAELTGSLTFFNPVYKISPMGFDGSLSNKVKFTASFGIPNELNLKIQTASPNYSLKYNLNVEAGIEAEFWTGFKASYSVDATALSSTLKEGNWRYKIGDTAFGGIIFYLDPKDTVHQHGLVCSLTDLCSGCAFAAVPPPIAYSKSIPFPPNAIPFLPLNPADSGRIDTDFLLAVLGSTNNVAVTCRNYNGGGFKDWYLPSFYELNQLYSKKDSVMGLSKATYWSSTPLGFLFPPDHPNPPGTVFMLGGVPLGFIDGQPAIIEIGSSYNTRAIRAF